MVTGTTKVLKKGEVLKSDLIYLAAADVDTDGSGDIAVTFPGLKEVVYAHLDIAAGYKCVFLSAALNVATFRVYWQDAGAAAGALVAAATQTDIAVAYGFALGK